jgi:hypothetical protein
LSPPAPGPVRFGPHALTIVGNGWRSIAPARGKIPLVEGWPSLGAAPPDDRRLKLWGATYPDANICFVMDGATVAIDADIAAENFAAPDASAKAATLADRLARLADAVIGKTPFIRVGRPPKWMRLYQAADVVPTMGGGPVEVFCAAGSKQIIIHGLHPDTRGEYRWTGKASPLTHSWSLLPPARAAQVAEFRRHAIEACGKAGFKLTKLSPGGVRLSNVPITIGKGGVVSELLSELLTLMAQAPDRDRREIAAEFFKRAEHGERHYHLVASVSALVLWGLDDTEIIEALKGAYAANVPGDPKMIGLKERPASVRAGMAARGAAVFPVSSLDREFGSDWSVFR